MTERPAFGLAMGALLKADTLSLLRNRTSGIITVLLPIILVVATSFGEKKIRLLGGPDLIIGLALTVGLLVSSLLGYAISLAQDRHAGVLQRLRVTPTPTWMIMASRLIVQLVVNLAMTVIVVVLGVVVHGLSLNPAQYALVLAISIFGAAVFLAIGQALVGLVNSLSAVNAIGRILFALLLLLGLVGATGILGDAVKAIADWSPVGALMTLFSDALNWSPWSDQDTFALLVGIGYIVIFSFVGIRLFRWDSK
ncbi:ABC-2 type transport system permease protein [Cryobacterium mesophilum]|uniref:ABC-2 type transporter transmembrane domain-containing protein n=1 Tax=Terrimesophilobacter mesophilus TaxID=433647 RepID=A0A4V3I9L4_9MICO|nr:ABC transporter permease [Terrimesophilobacter mesophilus]MBB5633165.1 ABC-2 type transport system permease protein [Terrimesophilobacter mesophilus]TFB79918.1 hypothetical protein E3N84_07585 [Terrimesophilobacter mesophilus]